MDLEALASLQPEHLRVLLPGYLAGHIDDPTRSKQNLARMTARVATWDDATCEALMQHLAVLGDEYRLYDPHPAVRALSRDWMRDVVVETDIEGVEHLSTGAPTVIIANHLSYVDSTAIDCALSWQGHEALADRIVSVAGPKVYQDTFRRIATSCLSTLPVPQSSSVAENAEISPRELARRAVRAIRAAKAALLAGRLLLIFAEGSRSRTGRLGSFLTGVHRYLEVPGARVVPLAIVGTRDMMPVGHDRLRPSRLSLTFGSPVAVGDPARETLDRVHEHLTALLPMEQRPE